MAGGISPYKTLSIPLGAYNADHYLILLYYGMLDLGWRIGYFDHDGIIAYTNISWESYAEEVSARIINNHVVIKSECVGYQGLFTDYGKNAKNLSLLMGEIEYMEFHLKDSLEQTTQELMDAVPEKQFLSLDDPPMAGKEQLHSFWGFIIPTKKYFVTPLLVSINTLMFMLTMAFMIGAFLAYNKQGIQDTDIYQKIYLMLGFSDRSMVLNGQVWRLLTNTFLHFSLLHLIGNMIVLVYIGSLIESKLGRWNYLFLYLATGIVSSMISVIWRNDGISAGASGAIFGLFGILLALLSTDFYEREARRALFISTAIFVTYNIIPIGDHIDHAAHFGGLFSGYVFGWIAYIGIKNENKAVQQWGVIVGCIAVVVAFVCCSLLYTPQYKIKEFNALTARSDSIGQEVKDYFYNYNQTDTEKLYTIEHKAMPEIKEWRKLGSLMIKLKLPEPQKTDARFRSKIINLECHFFTLLYLEFKSHDKAKYRPAINDDTQKINDLRVQWGKAEGY